LRVTGEVSVSILSPSWAITRKALPGIAENMNLNGIRIGGIHTEPGQSLAWQDAINDDAEIKVRLRFSGEGALPEISGRLVWVNPEPIHAGAAGVTCSVGILFAILKGPEKGALGAYVKGLHGRS
jgi:hypothetical protein